MESLDKLETQGSQMLLSANAGSLRILFPQEVWEDLLANAPVFEEPEPEELRELELLKERLEQYAREQSFASVLGGVECGNSGLEYDLVLRPAGLFAMTTGYHFAPVVGPELVARIGACLEEDETIEQAYVVGAVADEAALACGGESLRVLCIRGHSCSTSRFEMPPELWQVLSGRLGWRNVETIATGER
ncbi:MAG: hypothetical protein M3317_06060 [Actinomycetota bacterium]|nr:hypothetical protein [Actinomycetota bacterium]